MFKPLVGIVGPQDLVDKILSLMDPIKQHQFEHILFIIEQVEDTRALCHEELNQCEILLFAGQMAYEIFLEEFKENRLNRAPTLIYIKYDGSAFFRSFYEISVGHQGNISNFSPFTIDVLHENEVYSALNDIGLSKNEHCIVLDGKSTFSTDDWADMHEKFYTTGQSKFAITCLTSVASELQHRNIPVKRILPTTASITSVLDILYAKIDALNIDDLQIAAISVVFQESNRRPVNRYTSLRNTLKFQSVLIDFAEVNGASINFVNDKQVNIFTNKSICKKLTEDFKSMPLLGELEEKTKNNISIGIGIGEETAKAEHLAEKAMKFALSANEPIAFIAFSNDSMIGPLTHNNNSPLSFSTSLENKELQAVSKSTHLSPTTISKLVSLIQRNNKTQVTVYQLAESFNVSLRAASRILRQLNGAGYAELTGEEQPAGRGRPRKIYDIQLKI